MSIAEDIVERLAGSPVVSQCRYAGGDIAGASEVRLADGRALVAKQGPVVDVEARMLEAMGRSDAPVPQVIGYGNDVLLIERLPNDGALSGRAWSSLAAALNALHAVTSDTYGWDEDYALRHVKVPNARKMKWAEFWGENRLLCHLPHLPPALAKRVEALASNLPDIVPGHPSASLVHGDLWGGNVLISGDAISGFIDPCAFYGDREVDAASLTVFDHPPPEFFETLELESGWQERQPVYRLWMWLLHVRLFGSGYVAAVDRDLALLGF
ncbi:fructosamine kinase family protein [Qipengyuania sp. 1NDH17]|uniref:Fructosamine kinase family protein n=1 Tax=Qipengyuania polymorpha TaxID=2867234 RepID=A0ABS7IW27_9SPHN|nr:fructosamine kinase family protein [Qipengyuania polymorpha]MBX7457700.1 fructosamine kinase family protein [Qipengyuania polymorpha]